MNAADRDTQNKKVAYHEAAHAVLQWNLGFGVQRVWIDRIRHCGNSQPLRSPTDRQSRIGDAVVCVAGLAAQRYLEATLSAQDIHRSFTDFKMALASFLALEHLTDGEQLGVALELTRRTWTLLDTPELKKQIHRLVTPLLQRGCLFQRHVDTLLRGLAETPAARQKCRRFVLDLESQRDNIIAGVKGQSADFRWSDWSST